MMHHTGHAGIGSITDTTITAYTQPSHRRSCTSLCQSALPPKTGWKTDIRGIKNYADLPENCRKYIEFVEKEIEVPITMVSNGPGRDDIILK